MEFGPRNSLKGMIFAGCSFTWGQGLWYYSYSESIDQTKDENNGYNPTYYTTAHTAFKDTFRYPRLVANHFNTYEIVRPRNGGANDNTVKYWSSCFNAVRNPQEFPVIESSAYDYSDRSYDNCSLHELKKIHPEWFDQIRKIDKCDISHLVFQFTHWTRNLTKVVHSGKYIDIPISLTWDSTRPYQEKILAYLERHNISMEKLHADQISNCILEVKKFLQDCEDSGIKTSVISWPNKKGSSFFDTLRGDTWLNDRLVSFEHNGDTFYSIDDLMQSDQSLCISTDCENFNIPPTDSHPSLKCHRIIADGVIKKIKERQ